IRSGTHRPSRFQRRNTVAASHQYRYSPCPKSHRADDPQRLQNGDRHHHRQIPRGAAMKLSLTVEADAINVLALNAGRIAVDIDGIELADLINVVCDNGYSLRVADSPGKLVVEDPFPPIARFNGIQCSTAHITAADNTLLFTLSHQH